MASRKKTPVKPAQKPVPCQYGCGRMAEGSLAIAYYANEDTVDLSYNPRQWFNITVPCCGKCLAATIRVSVSIPEVKPHG